MEMEVYADILLLHLQNASFFLFTVSKKGKNSDNFTIKPFYRRFFVS